MTDLTTNTGLEIDLASTGARFTPVELLLPQNLPQSDWVHIGQKLCRAHTITQWWIGDWAAFGSPHPEATGWRKKGALIEFCRANGLEDEYGTISNKATISRSIHLSLRRERVSLGHFACLTAMKPKEQKYWIEKIEREGLSRGRLRREINLQNGEENALEHDGPTFPFGTKHFDDLKGWLLARPKEFWLPERRQIWEARTLELLKIVRERFC